MTDGFNVMPVRIQDKRSIVSRMIVRSQTRRSIVDAPCCKGGLIKRVH